MISRRGFLGALSAPLVLKFGNVTLTGQKPEVPTPIQPLPEPSTVLLPEGWYTVKVVDYDFRNRQTDGSEYAMIKMEVLDHPGKFLFHSLSPQASWAALIFLEKFAVQIHDEVAISLDLNDLIGKTAKVYVIERTFSKRKFNIIDIKPSTM